NLSVEAAAALARQVPAGIGKVALVVDPDDRLLGALARSLQPDLFQLHGAETPERVAAIRARWGIPVMKALAVASPSDIVAADDYAGVADCFLFDAKPPESLANALPGGNAVSFDWRMLAHARLARPWMLSGGLNERNLAEAVRVSGATRVDVSS